METRDEPSTQELYTLAVPNREAGERYMQLLLELWCNTPHEALDGRTPWEAIRMLGGLQAVEARLPGSATADPEQRAKREQELGVVPHLDRRQLVSFDRSGGLLNVFTDRPTPRDDDDWRRIQARAAPADPSARREASRRAAREWNELPSVLFAGLTPLQVLAGGGPQEAELLHHLSAFMEQAVDPQASYPSPAAVARSSLLLLRRWQVSPIASLGNLRPRQVIQQERTDILQRKLAFLDSR